MGTTRYHHNRRFSYLGLFLILTMVSAFASTMWAGLQSDVSVDDKASEVSVKSIPVGPSNGFHASEVEGHSQCVDCHPAEYKRWLKSKHAGRAFDLLRATASSLEYAKELDIDVKDIARKSICINCHATARQDPQIGSRVISGVSCEACHNGSGGDKGWLNVHAVYGPPGTTRDEESAEHYSFRKKRCQDAGQLRSSNTYELARRCLECHIVGHEKLVNAGHPDGGGFEFAEKSLGEVRHNFHLNQEENAEVSTLWTSKKWNGPGRTSAGRKRLMFVVGQLADLEVSLRNLAKTTDEDGDFLEVMADRIVDAYELIEEINEDAVLEQLTNALSTVEDIYTLIDDDELTLDNLSQCIEAADKVAKIGKEFASTSDGSNLSEVEEPEVPEE